MQKFFLILFVGVLCALVGKHTVNTLSVTDELLLQNVEALADIESKPPAYCEFSGNYICPNEGERVKYIHQGYGWKPNEEIY